MYELLYERSDGKTLSLGLEKNYFIEEITGLSGYSIHIASSQGYQQIGESFGSASIGAQSIAINGSVLYGDRAASEQLLSMFAPLTHGRLYIDGKYFIEVYVKETPALMNRYTNRFSIVFYAPFPFLRSAEKRFYILGAVTPSFSFPVNYAQPHSFGKRSSETQINCYSAGNMPVEFSLEIKAAADVKKPIISNIYTGEKLFFEDLSLGQKLRLFREGGILRVVLEEEGSEEEAFQLLLEESDLFMLKPGDNVLLAEAASGADALSVTVSFYDAYAGVIPSGMQYL